MKPRVQNELEDFLLRYPDTTMLEVLMVDMNGILRCKRIPRDEFEPLFRGELRTCASTPLCNTLGTIIDDIGRGTADGDPDGPLSVVPGTLGPIPWLTSATAQVLASFREEDGTPSTIDPRCILHSVLARFDSLGLKPMVATELEFYLLEPGSGDKPTLRLGSVPGTGLRQEGAQYAMPEDLWDNDAFLEDMRTTSVQQGIPMTTVLSEFSPGQFEINLHHVDDPVQACDHAVLLKRAVKGTARQHGMGATFMAKPFADIAGSGLHIHISLYDGDGNNVFADPGAAATPGLSDRLHNAVGGLAGTMGDCMAIFAPNANSYRRLIPGNFAPLNPDWGYNHRSVSLRIPVSSDDNRRIEHRAAGADANPYLVMAAVLAGIHQGLVQEIDPGRMVQECEQLEEKPATLPRHWPDALDTFEASDFAPGYLGADYCKLFAAIRRQECEEYAATIPDLDYRWYLRSV